MSETEKREGKKSKKGRSWQKRALYVILIIVILFLISIFVFKEHILEKVIKDAVHDKSNGKYELSFSKIDYRLRDNSILLLDFFLKGDTTVIVDDAKHNVYEIIIDTLEIRDISIFKIYPSRKLLIQDFSISSPLIKIYTGDTNTTKNPHIELKKAMHQSAMKFFEKISIDTFKISNGVLDIYKFPYDTSINSSIQSFDIQLTNFELDETSDTSRQNLFFSEHIDVSLKGFRKILKNHALSARKIRLTTSEELFEISGFEAKPDMAKNPVEKLEVITPLTQVKGFEIRNLALGEDLSIDSILIHKAFVHYNKTGESLSPNTYNYSNNKIYELLSPLVKKLSVDCFRLMDGNLDIEQKKDQQNQLIHVSDLSLLIERIVLDSNIAFLGPQKMVKGNVQITAKNSSLKNQSEMSLSMGGLEYSAEKEQLKLQKVNLIDPGQAKDTLILTIPDLTLTEVSIWSLIHGDFNKFGDLKVQGIDLYKRILKNGSTTSGRRPGNNLRFASIEVTNGKVELDFLDSTGKNATISTRSDIYAENLLIDTSGFKQPGFLDLKLYDLDFDDHENLSLNAGELDFNSQNRYLKISQIKASILANNKKKQKVNLRDLHLSSFELHDFDYWNIINRQQLDVRYTSIIQPAFNFLIDPEIQKTQKLHEVHHKIKRQVRDYLELIKLDSFRVEDLSASFVVLNDADDNFHLRDIDALFVGVKLDSVFETSESKLFYAEDFDLNFDNIRIPIKNERFDFSIDKIRVSKSSNSIDLLGVEYAPAELDSTEQNQHTRVKIPRLIANGVDFDNYYFEHDVDIEELDLPTSKIMIYSRGDTNADNKPAPVIRIPDFADSYRIGKISVKNSDMQLIEEGKFYLSTDLSAYFYDLNFDSSLILKPLVSKLPLDHFNILLKNVNSIIEKNNASIRIDSLYTSSQDQELQVHNLKYFDTISEASSEMILLNRQLSFEGLQFDSLFRGKGLIIRHLVIDSTRMQMGIHANEGTGKPDGSISLPSPFHIVNIGETDLLDVDFTFHNSEKEKSFSLDNIRGKVHNFKIDSSLIAKPGFLFSKSIDLAKSEYTIYSTDSMYTFSLKDIVISTGEERLDIGDFAIHPNYPKYTFSRELGYQTDRMDVDFQGIKIRGLNFRDLLNDQKLNAIRVEVNNTRFEAFRDKRVPFPEWHTSPMPQDLLESLDFDLMIDTLWLNNARITYGEMVEKSVNPGEIHFSDMQVRLTNVTNDSMRILRNPVMGLSARGQIMNKGLMNAQLNLKLNHPSDTFAFHANLTRMNLPEFNSLSVNLFGVEIKSGNGSVDTVNIFGNKDYAIGHLYFPYRKFKIKMINRQKGNRGGIGDGILTFLANNILLKSNNRRFGRPIRVGQIFYQRDPQKSIFNYLWKGVLSGVESTLGYNNREQRKEMKAYKQGLGNENPGGND